MKYIFQKSLGYIIALCVVFIYFVMSYLTVTDWQFNAAKTIVEGSLLFVCSIMVYNSLTQQGILNGRNDPKYIQTLTTHIEAKKRILPKLKYLQLWLNNDYTLLMKMNRIVFTDSAGIDYSDLFDDNGKVKYGFKIEKPKFTLFSFLFSEDWKIYRQRCKFLRKAKRYKITKLTVSDVINIDNKEDPNYFGISESEYVNRQNVNNIASRLIFSYLLPSVIFVFNGFSYETLLIQVINVLMITMSGLVSMFGAYFFMVRTHRETIIRKINKIEEFNNADLKEIVKADEGLCSEEPILAESNVVEEV